MVNPPHSGVWSIGQLQATGYTKTRLSRAVAGSELIHVRRGYYARPDADPSCLAAARLGGRLTSTSALRRHGCWVLPDARLHVAVSANASRLREPPDPATVLHWTSPGPAHQVGGVLGHDVAAMPPLLALKDLLADSPTRFAVAVLDSMLHERITTPTALRDLVATLPERIRDAHRLCDARAESGIESLTRVGLRDLGLRVEPQVPVGRARLDLLVEGRLAVELDGRETHGSPEAFERDRRRDAITMVAGVPTLRFTYGQVLYEWDVVAAAVLAALGAVPVLGAHAPVLGARTPVVGARTPVVGAHSPGRRTQELRPNSGPFVLSTAASGRRS